ncbi:MAG: NADH-quinone oxidoreductase subunit C [Ignavibacteriales bacterium]|nr:NADH-quinone oxidoreductase subunit C [Ignavibacteriales bacterium]
MKTPEVIFEALKQHFGEAILAQQANVLNEFMIDVEPSAIKKVSFFLVSEPEYNFDNLILISALDDANGKKVIAEDGSFIFEGGTLSLIYHLESTTHKHRLVLRVTLPKEKPEVESVSQLWQHADWEEREAYDMIGIVFLNHPDLRRILMPYDWDAGYPLRKDYKNPEFYQGMKVPY